MATEIKRILNNAYSIRQIVTLSTLLSSWDVKNYGDKMKSTYYFILALLLLSVGIPTLCLCQVTPELNATAYLSDTTVRNILFPSNKRAMRSYSFGYATGVDGCKEILIDNVHFEPPYSSAYEVVPNDSSKYTNAHISLAVSTSESNADSLLSKLNTDLQEDISTKLQPYYTDFFSFPSAGKDAVLFTGYNTSTERAKMLLRFRVKKLIMTIETSGLSKEFVLPKFVMLYEIAKVNMEKY